MTDFGYAARTQGSAALYQRALGVFPGGITHDARSMDPYPVYIERADGAHKWDVDGHEYIDYWMGHGALLLGHGHPAVAKAVADQVADSSHYGASHRLEVEWGELVQKLVPCAERVRFVASGTEATLLAMRLARAFTGRGKVLRFHEHFHGWHDFAVVGMRRPYDAPSSPGIAPGVAEAVVHIPPGDADVLERALAGGDIACVIMEASGGVWGTIPVERSFLRAVEEAARRHGTLLILDEVITGFRLAPGGAQEYFGLRPDLCTLAKCLAGGLPGGAVAGRAEIMTHLAAKPGDAQWNRYRKIMHPGTFNANPLSAAAGLACLKILETGEPQKRASALGERLRRGFNHALRRRKIQGIAYGFASFFHVHLGPGAEGGEDGTLSRWDIAALAEGAAGGGPVNALRRAMLVRGVDLVRAGGFLSAAHTEADVDATIAAFESSLDALTEVGVIRPG